MMLPHCDWVLLSESSISGSYFQSAPFYVSTDGILFIVKDSKEDTIEMTNEQKILFHCEEYESQIANGPSFSKTLKNGKGGEAAVKITVKQKDNQE